MGCVSCGSSLVPDARFCGACGSAQEPRPEPPENPARVLEYRDALRSMITAGALPTWAEHELRALRSELGIQAATHSRLLEDITAPEAAALLGAFLDEGTFQDFRIGDQCLVRIKIVNEGYRAIKSATVHWRTSATDGEQRVDVARALGPGDHEVLRLMVQPRVGGHHELQGRIEVQPMRGASVWFELEPVTFRVAGGAALQQNIHIDARSQRVGIFENIGGRDQGGLVEGARWRRVALVFRQSMAPMAGAAAAGPRVGERLTGKVVARSVGRITVSVGGVEGRLVEVHDPAILAVLGPGDSIRVTVIGSGAEGLLLSTAPASVPVTAPSMGSIAVAAGTSLQAAVESAPKGSRIVIAPGRYEGPIHLEKPLTLVGEGEVIIEVSRRAAVVACADVVLENLVLRGAAPAGHYAPDGLVVEGGRVSVKGCTISVNADGNLTPGRGVAVVGKAEVEIETTRILACGVGVALDVSWGGFMAGSGGTMKVTVTRSNLSGNTLAAAAAGKGRELRILACTLGGDPAVRLMDGALGVVEDSRVVPAALVKDATSTLSQRGNAP